MLKLRLSELFYSQNHCRGEANLATLSACNGVSTCAWLFVKQASLHTPLMCRKCYTRNNITLSPPNHHQSSIQ